MKIKIITCLLTIIVLPLIEFGISQKVAIVGKNAGGALCSYFLHKTIPGIKIDIYNHQHKKETLFSGLMFNSNDLYINNLVKEYNIRTVINRDHCIIKEGNNFYISDIKKSVEYKSFHEELIKYSTQQLEIFKQIYDFQKNGRMFKTVRELLKSLSPDFENYYINETTESLLFQKNTFIAANPSIIKYIKDELAFHFSDTNAHGFIGLGTLMFSEIIEEIQQVIETDNDLFTKSLINSNDKIIEKDVFKIVREDNQNYIVPKFGNQTPYDFIIFATTAADQIQCSGFTDPVKVFKYRESHFLAMTGILSKKFKKITKDYIPIYDRKTNRIYMQIPLPTTTFYSISGLEKIPKSDISQYMKSYNIRATYYVHAPPDYSVKDDESLRNAKFELGENLYNAHALHSLSTVDEMLAIGAKNISLLIKNQIEEIGTFANEQMQNQEGAISMSVVGQRSNQTIDDQTNIGASSRSIVGRRSNQTIDDCGISSRSIVGRRSNQTINDKRTSGQIVSSSTVGRRTRSGSGKSRPNRNKSKTKDSKKKF